MYFVLLADVLATECWTEVARTTATTTTAREKKKIIIIIKASVFRIHVVCDVIFVHAHAIQVLGDAVDGSG